MILEGIQRISENIYELAGILPIVLLPPGVVVNADALYRVLTPTRHEFMNEIPFGTLVLRTALDALERADFLT